MPLQLLQYKPGIVKDITEYSAGKNVPFLIDGSLGRFRNGYPMKIGGWQEDEIFRTDSAGTITSTITSASTGALTSTITFRTADTITSTLTLAMLIIITFGKKTTIIQIQ